MGFLRRTRDQQLPSYATSTPADLRVETARGGLSDEQREAIEAELARHDVGDAIERRLFLAALDYQLGAFAGRVRCVVPDGQRALAERACAAAARSLDGRIAGEAERICRGFVTELARAFDACFETPPTAEEDGPFLGILRRLRTRNGGPLICDEGLVARAIDSGATPGAY